MTIFNQYYKSFKIEPKDLTSQSIRNLKIATLAAIPSIPLLALCDYLLDHNLPYAGACIGFAILSLIALTYVGSNRVVSTLSRTNKNLDEWEVGHKLHSGTFAFRIMTFVAVAVSVIAFISVLLGNLDTFTIKVSLMDIAIFGMLIFHFGYMCMVSHLAWTLRPIDDESLTDAKLHAKAAKRRKKVETVIYVTLSVIALLVFFIGAFAWGWMDAHSAAGH